MTKRTRPLAMVKSPLRPAVLGPPTRSASSAICQAAACPGPGIGCGFGPASGPPSGPPGPPLLDEQAAASAPHTATQQIRASSGARRMNALYQKVSITRPDDWRTARATLPQCDAILGPTPAVYRSVQLSRHIT